MHDDANPADCVVVWGCLARPGSADFGMTLVAADPRAREAGPVDLPDAAPRGQPETGVDRPMEIRALGGAKTEGHGVRLLDLLNRQGASGKDRPHSLFHLA